MALFKITNNDKVSQVITSLIDESIYVKPNSILNLQGNINAKPQNNFIKFKEFYSTKRQICKLITLKGNGSITHNYSLGTFSKITLENTQLIINPKAFWVATASLTYDIYSHGYFNSIIKNLPKAQLRFNGCGNIIVLAKSKIETLELNKDKIILEQPAIAFEDSITLNHIHPSKTINQAFTTNNAFVYEGSGKIYYCNLANKALA